MNIYDAAKILGLSGNLNPQDTKAAYRAACKKYHPDLNPAGEEMMKIVNQAYDALKEYSGEIKSEQSDYGDLLNDALNRVLGLSGLMMEICGSWRNASAQRFTQNSRHGILDLRSFAVDQKAQRALRKSEQNTDQNVPTLAVTTI